MITALEVIEQRLTSRTDELRRTTLQLATAEQRERDRLAAILHDDLQQLLLAAKWNLSSLRKHLRSDRALGQQLRQAIRMVNRSIEMSRSLSRELSATALESGLIPAVERLVQQFRDVYHFHVELTVADGFSLVDGPLRDFLFQGIRELLINAVKHCHCTEAKLQIRQTENMIEVIVSDAGVGLDVKQLDRILSNGSGLLRLWTRATTMGGQLLFESSPGTGATFRLAVPKLKGE